MDELIAQFPKQIADAIQIAKEATLTFHKGKSFQNIVICGMGGSGIGGKMVSQLFAQQLKIPVIPISGYDIPYFINGNSLVIGSSYSGNTEEILQCMVDSQKKGATIVGVSSGGDLIRFCKKNNYNYIRVPGGNPPRSMLAFSLVQLTAILVQLGVIRPDAINELSKCRQFLNNELIEIKKKAKELANIMYKKQAVFYTDTKLETVAIRARQQMNENGKVLCWHHVIPEMTHNELVGWGGGNATHAVVLFVSQFLNEKNKKRIAFCEEVIQKKTPNFLRIEGRGANTIEEVFYFIHIIDWASLYLANLKDIDPVEVQVIEQLKKSLL